MTNDERAAIKPEHEELIEAIAVAMDDDGAGSAVKCRQVVDGLRAAAERGYFLASLPRERLSDSLISDLDESRLLGFQDCLELIDTVRVDE